MSPPSSTSSISQEIEGRKYRITAVIGKGGFGKVYRAVMEGAGGFHKDVAIKLMHNDDVPELTLQRFRDEARILGLIRDRAIVTVDPPTRLAGRWAVVMEFVDGASVQRLMKLGPMPPGVVAEIVQEIARALDKVYRQPGPDGQPLRLLHRDIKPGNLQVTQDGEVKILDFGIARADFSHREAHTQVLIGGTRGYIAPERLEGSEGPEGDVYSLGVTMHYMVTGKRPSRRELLGLAEPDLEGASEDLRAIINLATRMRSVVAAERPSAREVEEELVALRRTFEGLSLRHWAEQNVPRAAKIRSDEMVGHVLSETLAAVASEERVAGLMEAEELEERATPPPPQPPRVGWAPIIAVFSAAAIVGVALLGFLSVGGAASAMMWFGVDSPPAAEAPGLPVPIAAPASVSPSTKAPEPSPAEALPPQEPAAPAQEAPPVQAAPVQAPDPAPAREAPPVTPPNPKQASPKQPKPTGRTHKIAFTSVPFGADLFVDGVSLGTTPQRDIALTEGPHKIRMVSDDGTLIQTIEVGRRPPKRYMWRAGTDTLKDYY